MARKTASFELPSVIHTDETDLKSLTFATNAYLKKAGFQADQVKEIFQQIHNLEWDLSFCEQFVKVNFPGKQWNDDRSRVVAAFQQYHTLIKKLAFRDAMKAIKR